MTALFFALTVILAAGLFTGGVMFIVISRHLDLPFYTRLLLPLASAISAFNVFGVGQATLIGNTFLGFSEVEWAIAFLSTYAFGVWSFVIGVAVRYLKPPDHNRRDGDE